MRDFKLTKADLPCTSYSSTVVTTQVHVEPTYNDRHGGVGSHGDKEERSILQVMVVMYGDQNSESSDAYSDGEDGEKEAVFEPVREPCDKHRETKSGGPWRNTVQLCLDLGVTIALDDGGREVGVTIGRYDQAEVHESANEDLGVLEHIHNVLGLDRSFTCGASLVDLKSGFDKRAFGFREPLHFFREVWEQKEESERNQNSQESFQNEDPSARVSDFQHKCTVEKYLQP